MLKSTEAKLLLALAAANGAKVVKTDTKRASLYGDMGDDGAYIRQPDWWSEPIPEGHVLLLLKSIYGTRQASRKWHIRISTWMEYNGYKANSVAIAFDLKCNTSLICLLGPPW